MSALVAPASACTDASGSGGGKLIIATTVAPLTSIVSAIAGDRAQVEGAIPEGTNSHTFEPPPKVAELMSKADLIVLNGLKLEEPTKDLAKQNMKSTATIAEVGDEAIPRDQWIFDFSFPEKDGKPNPHGWTDPTLAVKYAAGVRDALVDRDPANRDYYQQNFTAFAAAANRLADAMRADQQTIPNGRRVLLTYHDAYAYFGRTFGWTIVGAVQPRNFEDPTPADVARLIEQIRAEKVPTIFGSEVFPSAVLEEIGRATGARYEDTLRDDDLPGKPGQAEHSWLGLMRYNFITMVHGMGGTTARLDAVPVAQSNSSDRAVYPQ
jgi:ABC-type Zn uptake system ZnuABC Zn-binding protein ZnuA